MDSILDNMIEGVCVICNIPIKISERMTCSARCHEEFVNICENKWGKTKRVVDIDIPTRVIIEKGLNHKDLISYPVWDDKDGKYEKDQKNDKMIRDN